MKFIKPPNIIQKFYKNLICNIKNDENKIFLTFDDCSDEEVTFDILDILDTYKIKATFFCTAKYIETNKLHEKIIARGHSIGNHGYEHLNGYNTSVQDYVSDVFNCNNVIDTELFRPPYGKITPKQLSVISKSYKVILWDVLSYDFSQDITPVECFEIVKKNTRSGAIIVFHASKKASRNMLYALPNFIEFAFRKKYIFSLIK